MRSYKNHCIVLLLFSICFTTLLCYSKIDSLNNEYASNCSKLDSTLVNADGTELKLLFAKKQNKYIISKHYVTSDTIIVPDNTTLLFDGGSIQAPIVFNKTKLEGAVLLHGSSLGGTISNSFFDASWICLADGKSDDSHSIMEILKVSNKIIFPSGLYYLKSISLPNNDIPSDLKQVVSGHILVNKSEVSFEGQKGAKFITEKPTNIICVYTKPNDIDNSISDININGLEFIVKNNKRFFSEHTHSVKLVGANNVTISNCTFNDFWGDAICLSHYGDTPSSGERTRNTGILIKGNRITGGSHNNRNGISVINGKDVYIIDNDISDLSKEGMPGGIDLEANNNAYTVDNINIIGNQISNITGSGICIVSEVDAPAHNVTIERNHISKCSAFGLLFKIGSLDCVSNVRICDNAIDNGNRYYTFIGEGSTSDWSILNNNFNKELNKQITNKVKIKNLKID